jgi:hypothetical protein
MLVPITSNGAGNAAAAIVACSAAAVGVVAAGRPAVAAASYLTASAATYCLRRGVLHMRPDGSAPLGAAEVLRRHLVYETAWDRNGSPTLGRVTHACHVAAWVLLFAPLWPPLEAILQPFDLSAFWFYYPRARGSGLIIDSRARRRAGKKGNAAQVFRLDWHRFELNVGPVYPPRRHRTGTGRHPPSVTINLPHVDLPQRGVKHWPWRQHTSALLRLRLLPAVQRTRSEVIPTRAGRAGHAAPRKSF